MSRDFSKIKTIFDVLIKVPKQYEETHSINGFELSLENSVDDVVNTIRYGEVISVPMYFDTGLKKGDVVFFHHNIIRTPNKMNNEAKYQPGHYDYDRANGLFKCPVEEIYAKVDKDGILSAIEPYCFIKPAIDKNGKESVSSGSLRYSNKELIVKGYKAEDNIVFYKLRDYPFYINKEKFYRMETKDIICKIEN